jgi:hypothetical protein
MRQGSLVKTLIAIAVILGLSALLMPALVRTPQPVEYVPGSDPARPH